ncbi:MAG TPA: DoxX family protein [Acidobacteriaceae bacterium]|jgi:hypothetical protein|nr:DoxX family protein [Acidobacteriaceae bacterium]
MSTAQQQSAGRARVIAYWGITALLGAELLTGGVWDVLRTQYVVGVVSRLGYPLYILTIVGVWKLLAVPALLTPGLARLKEWTYAGIFFEMTGAAVSHAACREGTAVIAPLVIAGLAMISWSLRPHSRAAGAWLQADKRAQVRNG